MCAIWRAVNERVMAAVNFIPMTSFGSGSICMVLGFRVVFMVILRVNAFLSQSVMVYHPFLVDTLIEGFASAFQERV